MRGLNLNLQKSTPPFFLLQALLTSLGKIAIGTSQKIYDAICLPFYLLNILWYRRSAGGEHFAKYIQVINYVAIINVQH
jgi:hypothetical protein